jgi:hypothetical protein
VVAAAEPILSVVKAFLAFLAERDEQGQQMMETMLRTVRREVPDEASVQQLVRNAEARARFLRDVPTLTSADVARLTGSTAKNVAAKANRLKSQKQIFSVTFKKTDYFPAFQFGADGEPLPVMNQIMTVFGSRAGWALALWFMAPNSWLAGKSPAESLKKDPKSVVEAARRSTETPEV